MDNQIRTGLQIKVETEKLVTCYTNPGMGELFIGCPFGFEQMQTECQVCIRKKEKVLSSKTVEETILTEEQIKELE